MRDITEVLTIQEEVRRSELRYRRLFEASRDGVILVDPDARKIIDANPFMTELLGYSREELIGRELFEIGLLKDRQASIDAFEQLRAQGSVRYADLPLVTKTGEPRTVEFVSHLCREDGHETIQCNVRDVTARNQADSHRELLMAELDHRLKNTLVAVETIARHTRRSAASAEEFSTIFGSRLLALSQTHNLLRAGEWRTAQLREMVTMELSPYTVGETSPFTLAGEDVQVGARQALPLGLALHELTTNAVKYGSLSVPTGKVRVDWQVVTSNGEQLLEFRWIESGGPVVKAPARRGFGSQLIEQSLIGEHGAEVNLDFHPDGVRFALRLPLDSAGG
jgi:PAS domain S-box-containing protein